MFGNSNKYIQLVGGFVAIVFGVLQGIDWIFNKYEIDSFYFNLILLILISTFILSVVVYFRKRSKSSKQNKKLSKKSKAGLLIGVFLTAVLIIIFIYFFRKINTNQNLVNQTIPEIIDLYDNGKINQVFSKTKSLLSKYPNNKILKNYFEKSSGYAYLKTNLDGVKVSIQYGNDSIYQLIGKTPIDSFIVPWSVRSHKIKLEYGDKIFFENGKRFHNYILPDPEITYPNNHKIVLGTKINLMWFQGLEFREINLPPFSISKNEVSNLEYQKFVDAGGYENPRYWDFPLKVGEKIYDFNNSVKFFTGKYGKLGPANWTYGKYPEGLENHPVTGISWFEARAYANFKGLSIPNVYEWLYASGASRSLIDTNVTNNSNYNSSVTREVSSDKGAYNGLNNIAGNVKEWVSNPYGENKEKYSVLGGSYLEFPYTYNNFYSLKPLDRTVGNGIRLVKKLSNKSSELDSKIIPEYNRNSDDLVDISDEVFEIYKSQFDYDNRPLNSKTENIDGFQEGYTAQRFEMETTYESDEKLFGYIVFSNKFTKQYNPLIIFPSAASIGRNTDKSLPNNLLNRFKYLIDEGYAIVHPIYKNTYSRQKNYKTFWPDASDVYKNTIVSIGQDFKRSIDYIESRNDFKIGNLSYFGYSWGSTTSNYLLAIDNRIKSAFICVGGLMMQKSKKEVEAHYYLRRIKVPILHIAGKLDGIFGYDETFVPWKNLVGTEEKDLKIIELENIGHGIPNDTIIKYHQNWIENYFTE